MSVKKAKGKDKGKAAAKNSGAKSAAKTKKPVDLVKVRESITELVGASAEEIANRVIAGAKSGQLASAKYLFEAVGLYPPTEQTEAIPVEESMAHTLLKRMGLPLEPVVCDEDLAPAALVSDAKSPKAPVNGSERGAEEERAGAGRGGERRVDGEARGMRGEDTVE